MLFTKEETVDMLSFVLEHKELVTKFCAYLQEGKAEEMRDELAKVIEILQRDDTKSALEALAALYSEESQSKGDIRLDPLHSKLA